MQFENSKNSIRETKGAMKLLYKAGGSLDKLFKMKINKLLRNNLVDGKATIHTKSDLLN